jgi:hypothetical protein
MRNRRYYARTNGHYVEDAGIRNGRKLRRCPCYLLGKPCEGLLMETGAKRGKLRSGVTL